MRQPASWCRWERWWAWGRACRRPDAIRGGTAVPCRRCPHPTRCRPVCTGCVSQSRGADDCTDLCNANKLYKVCKLLWVEAGAVGGPRASLDEAPDLSWWWLVCCKTINPQCTCPSCCLRRPLRWKNTLASLEETLLLVSGALVSIWQHGVHSPPAVRINVRFRKPSCCLRVHDWCPACAAHTNRSGIG